MNRALLTLTAVLLSASSPAAQAQTLLDTLEPPPAPITTTRFGSATAGVPDVNGDGHGDLLVGAYRAGVSPNLAGRAYLYSGSTGALIHTLAPPAGLPQDFFGEAVASVPDTDGDGVSDLLVGASGVDQGGFTTNAGRAYLFSGATGALLRTLTSPNEQDSGQFGYAVAGVPDVNGDGRGDLLIGSFETANDVFISGRAYVFSGATGDVLNTLVSPDIQPQGQFGAAVAGVSDLDGDGRGDLLIGARREEVDNTDSAGRAYLFSGATGVLLRTMESADPALVGFFGAAVSSVPDTDGDGLSDLLIGAQYENGEFPLLDMGRAYLFSGATGRRLHTLNSPNAQEDGYFGWSVSGVPDVNGDGRGDLLIGAHTEHPGEAPYRSGRAYLFDGATGSLLTTLVSPDAGVNGQFGNAVAGVPDTNGDGRGDLLVGAWLEDRSGLTDAGNVYLFSGAATLAPALIEPVGSTTLPASGGTLSYRVSLTNPTAQNQNTEAWIVAVLPNGSEFGPVQGPQTVPLGPGQTIGPISFTEAVPGAAPPGAYSLVLRMGIYPDTVTASDAFAFTKQASSSASQEASAGSTGLPEYVVLDAAYPNPFSRSAMVGFALPEAGVIRLVVYDALGREVARLVDGEVEAGRHEAVLDGTGLPSGVYLARLIAGETVRTQRLTLVR